MGRLFNLLLLVLITYGFYRVISDVLPTLPWEASAPSPSPSAAATGHGPLRIGISDRPACVVLQVLKEKTPDRDFAVEIVNEPDDNRRWQMLASGRLDMACGTLDSLALALARHRAGYYVFSIGQDVGEDGIVATGDLKQVSDLAGKTIAVPDGGPADYLLGLFLDRAGLSPSQTTRVVTSTVPHALAMLQSGKVQAAVLSEPYLGEARRKGATLLATTADPKAPRLEDICAVSSEALGERRAQLKTLFLAHFKLVEKLKTNPGLGREQISKATGKSAASLKDELETVQFYTLSDNRVERAAVTRRLAAAMDTLVSIEKNLSPIANPEAYVNLDIVGDIDLSPLDPTNP